jgi:hypothetical protein
MQHRILIAALSSLLMCGMPGGNAQASEVVKLARLVLTGKRTVAEPHRESAPVATEKSPALPTLPPLPEPGGNVSEAASTGNLSGGAAVGAAWHSHTFLRPL